MSLKGIVKHSQKCVKRTTIRNYIESLSTQNFVDVLFLEIAFLLRRAGVKFEDVDDVEYDVRSDFFEWLESEV